MMKKQVLSIPEPPPFEARAALYFLEEGHYLFRHRDEKGQISSKFVTVPDLAAAFADVETDSGWVRPGVVRHGHNAGGDWFVYSAPAQKLDLKLQNGEDIESIKVPIPRTVLAGAGRTYYMWALRSRQFDPDAEAHHAPFPNVYPDGGRVCWGSNHPPAAHHSVARTVWELFVQSPFNRHLVAGKSSAQPNDVCVQLEHLARRKARRYPTGDLVPIPAGYRHDEASIAWLIARVIGEE